MSIKSIWRWFVGDDEPLGPESERGLFNHFNRPESLPWPPDHPDYSLKPKPRQFRVEELSSSAAYYEEEQRRFFAEERRKHIEWLNQLFPKSGVMFVDPDVRSTRGSAHGEFRIGTNEDLERQFPNGYQLTPLDTTEPRELKPTVGYFYETVIGSTMPPRAVPYTVRPDAVVKALDANIPMEVHEYIVHLESHFARTHHHGK